MKTQEVDMPLAELVEDMELYPRHAVDAANVQSLSLALESGQTLPPIVADKKSKRITDGWHRRRAYQRVVGPDAVVSVLLVQYPNDAAMVFDSVLRNASHGRKLDRMDQTRSAVMLERHGFDQLKIGAALHIPQERVAKIIVKTATGVNGKAAIPGTSKITLKRPVQHMEGKKLTKRQTEVHDLLPGTSFLLIAKQLCEALSADLVNRDDPKLTAQLELLKEELQKFLG